MLSFLILLLSLCANCFLLGRAKADAAELVSLGAENAVLKSELERLRNTEIPVKITR